MNKTQIISLLLCLCLAAGLLGGCAPANSPAPTDTVPTEQTAQHSLVRVGVDPLPCSEEALYAQLFDPKNRIDVEIDMPDSELAKLQADFERNRKSPIYRMADMTITITSDGPDGGTVTTYRIDQVGVRMKGNTSRTDFYNAEEGIYNAIHLKIDFQETFDDEELYGADCLQWPTEDAREARKDRTFATLEKLEMRWNKCYDSTYLKEGYAYALYRAHGVLAPLTNLCSFDWSGLHMGVYTINEPVDKIFLEKRLPESALGGDLYKLGWTNEGATFTKVSSIGIEDELKNEFYTYDLKTNKKTSQHEALTHLITRLNSGAVSEQAYAELVDVDYFLRFAAVSYFLGNPDDLRNNYNNCYLYFLQDSGKAILIPYDYDRCLGVTYEWNPSGDGMTSDNPFSDLRDGAEHQPAYQQNPLFLYSVARGGHYVAEFGEVLKQVAADELLLPETFRARFDHAVSIYGSDTQPSRELRNGNGRDWGFSLEAVSGGNLSFERYITAKLETYRSHMEKLGEYAAYERPAVCTHYIRGNFNDWTSHPDYGMENVDGLLQATLTFSDDFCFKVYGEQSGIWYGVESLPEGTGLEYTTDSYGNIHLKPGSYLVTFDPAAETVTVTKK